MSRPRVPFETHVLTLLLLVISSDGALARPPGLHADISSSLSTGGGIFGEKFGPFYAGQKLTLTCSVENSPVDVRLAWFEGESELKSEPAWKYGTSLSDYTVESLSLKDHGRRLTCRSTTKGTNINRTAVLSVFRQLHISVDGEPLNADASTVYFKTGINVRLYCVNQGYSPLAVSWWEGETQLSAESSVKSYFSCSTLSLNILEAGDTGRTFTCRLQGHDYGRSVTLDSRDNGGRLPSIWKWDIIQMLSVATVGGMVGYMARIIYTIWRSKRNAQATAYHITQSDKPQNNENGYTSLKKEETLLSNALDSGYASSKTVDTFRLKKKTFSLKI